MKAVKQYILNILINLDQGVNTLLGGDPDETISSRLGKSHRGDYGKSVQIATYLPWFITNSIFYIFGSSNHCEQSIEEDRGKNDVLLNNIKD